MFKELFKRFDEKVDIKNENEAYDNKPKHSEEEKLQAAYALNLCTVSVAQIIEYNDVRFLEEEYETILNNLNLENMPKDEALLKIIKQMLDVITFFRIQDKEKKLLNQKYERRVKDAIWSAVPNTAVVYGNGVAGIAFSLASMVGIGYMNYRREKSKIAGEKEEEEWKLQKAAIEQFNGLQRELFDTAWRMAKEYDFPDNYRLTERQIKRFNSVLLDQNPERRFERLCELEGQFFAYPAFWYYKGSAANESALVLESSKRKFLELQENNDLLEIPEIERIQREKNRLINESVNSFETYFKRINRNLLREDQLSAQCALEYYELLGNFGSEVASESLNMAIKDKRTHLIEQAVIFSNGAYDTKQLCAIDYVKEGELSKSLKLLKELVNENYNTEVNAQIYSRLLIEDSLKNRSNEQDNKTKYENLKRNIGDSILIYTWPEKNEELEHAESKLIEQQKSVLLASTKRLLTNYVNECENEFINASKEKEYVQNEFVHCSCLLEKPIEAIFPCYDRELKSDVIKKIKENQAAIVLKLNDSKSRSNGNSIICDVFEEPIKKISKKMHVYVKAINTMRDLSSYESDLYNFDFENHDTLSIGSEFATELIKALGGESAGKIYELRDYAIERLNQSTILMFSEDEKTKKKQEGKNYFHVKGAAYEKEFNKWAKILKDQFFWNNIVRSDEDILAVLHTGDTDLFFTTYGLILRKGSFIKHKYYAEEWNGIDLKDQSCIKIQDDKYDDPNGVVDMKKLNQICKDIKTNYVQKNEEQSGLVGTFVKHFCEKGDDQ